MILSILAAPFAGCTEANPAFVASDLGPASDGATPGRDGAGRDKGPRSDTRPNPDVVPPTCTKDPDCDDKRPCTVDKCTGGKCTNAVESGFCVVRDVCFKSGETSPTNSCESCDPTTSTMSFTVAKDGNACADDGLKCTKDVCAAGKCVHPLSGTGCAIAGKCYDANQLNAANSCQACDPSRATEAWSSLADDTTCVSDGLSCTGDVCKGGSCTHPVTRGCMVNSTCYEVGEASTSNVCLECLPTQSTSSLTFVAGKPCTAASGVAKMCAQNACKGWLETTFEPSPSSGSVTSTSLAATAPLASPKEVWAVGEYSTASSSGQGIMVRLAGSGSASLIYAERRLNDVHYRVAVGDNGLAYYHDGTSWGRATGLSTQLAGATRYGVWGASTGANEVFYLTGMQSLPASGAMVRCLLASGSFSCTSHSGFLGGTTLGNIFGATSGSAVSALWAITGTGQQDIYYNDGMATSWSTDDPEGCLESRSGSACSNLSGNFRRMFAASAGEIWVVGDYGTVMRYDGALWQRMTSVFNQQSNYNLTAVYASNTDHLATLVGYRDTSSGRTVSLFNYNLTLKRAYGPLQVRAFSSSVSGPMVRDIDGESYADLWMVGQTRTGTGSGGRLQGWVLQLK